MVLVKLQVAYHMSVLGLTFSQANVAGRKYILAEHTLMPFSIIFINVLTLACSSCYLYMNAFIF